MSGAAFDIISVEGNRQRLDGGAMFGSAPRALWARWIAPDARHRIPLACRAFLLLGRAGQGTWLVDAGIGAFFPPDLADRYGVEGGGHLLLRRLAALGVAPEAVDGIVLSHLHFDHAGGVLEAHEEGRPLRLAFPRTRFVVHEAALARARAPHPRDRASFIPELPGLLAASGRLEVVSGEAGAIAPGLGFTRSDGHTPGMMVVEIAGPDGPAIFCADLVPGTPWVHLPITMGYDRFAERIVDEKARLLGDALARGARLLFAHDPACAASHLARDDRGRYRPRDPVGALDTRG